MDSIKKCLSLFFCFCFILTSIAPPAYAQALMGKDLAPLPEPGKMVALSSPVNPPVLRGIKVYTNDPLKFDFILDPGDKGRKDLANLKETSNRLLKYFLTTLTVPEDDIWVNLSPYEKNRIIPQSFGQTEMGRDILGQDYLLKQITASLMFPQGEAGKKFWAHVYEEAKKKFGTTQIPIDTFNKVWIMPDKAVVYEKMGDKQATAFVIESRLKVMLESDYIAAGKHMQAAAVGAIQSKPLTDTQKLSRDIAREIIIPILDKEVNEGANFAPLRQVYSSILLALWYKDRMKNSILSSSYVNRNKIAGVNVQDKSVAQKIWQRYVKAYKKGAFNFISEQKDTVTSEIIPRKYFAGGFTLENRAMLTQYLSGTKIGRHFQQALAAFLSAGLMVVSAGAQTQEPIGMKPSSAVARASVNNNFLIDLPIAANPTPPPDNWGYNINNNNGVFNMTITYPSGSSGITGYKYDSNTEIVTISGPYGESINYSFNSMEGQNVLLEIVRILQHVSQITIFGKGTLNEYINSVLAQLPSLVNIPYTGAAPNGYFITWYPDLNEPVSGLSNGIGGLKVIITTPQGSYTVNVDLNTGDIVYSNSGSPETHVYTRQSPREWEYNLNSVIGSLLHAQQISPGNADNLKGFINIFFGWIKYGFFPAVILNYPTGDGSSNSEYAYIVTLQNRYANSVVPLENSLYALAREAYYAIERLFGDRTYTTQGLWQKVHGMDLLINRLQQKYSPEEFQKLSLVKGYPIQKTPLDGPYISGTRFDVIDSKGEITTYFTFSLAPKYAVNLRSLILIDTSVPDALFGRLNRIYSLFNTFEIANTEAGLITGVAAGVASIPGQDLMQGYIQQIMQELRDLTKLEKKAPVAIVVLPNNSPDINIPVGIVTGKFLAGFIITNKAGILTVEPYIPVRGSSLPVYVYDSTNKTITSGGQKPVSINSAPGQILITQMIYALQVAEQRAEQLPERLVKQLPPDYKTLIDLYMQVLQQAAGNNAMMTQRIKTNSSAVMRHANPEGGIDLRKNSTPLELRNNEGKAIIFNIDPAQMARINASPGLTPQVFTIGPLQSLPAFLGMSKQESQDLFIS